MNTGNPFYQKPRISSRFFPGLSCRKLQIRGQIKSALKRETGDWIITRANYWSLALWVTLYFFSAACSLRSRLDTEPHEAWRKALGEVETSTSGNEQKRSSIIMAGRVYFLTVPKSWFSSSSEYSDNQCWRWHHFWFMIPFGGGNETLKLVPQTQ